MRDVCRTVVLVSCLVGALCGVASGSGFRLVPVAASGDYTLYGNLIILEHRRQQVFLEIRITDWDPDQDGMPLLRAWQASIDSAGFSSGLAGTILPYEYACISNSDCTPVLGSGSGCTGSFCANSYIDIVRPDYVFNNPDVITELPAIDVSTLDRRYGSTIVQGDPVPGSGQDVYAGTLVVHVPNGARGIFAIRLKSNPSDSSLLTSEDEYITPLDFMPAMIGIACGSGLECDDNDPCTNDVCGLGSLCRSEPNFNQAVSCCYSGDGTLCEKPIGSPGDFDGDNWVDLADFARLQTCFGSAPLGGTCDGVDLGCDCECNDLDVAEFVPAMTGP